jgi:large subunit ribosomal protein L6
MSRIGRNPIPILKGVTVSIKEQHVDVKGKLGSLELDIHNGISAKIEDEIIIVSRENDSKSLRAKHGLVRALIANMIKGVSEGYLKTLELVGVGYKSEQRGKALQLSVGFSHKIIFIAPEGIELKVLSATSFTVSGIDKQLVGETAASIRKIRPPEPYKGKGIKYKDEYIRRKAGKAAVK